MFLDLIVLIIYKTLYYPIAMSELLEILSLAVGLY